MMACALAEARASENIYVGRYDSKSSYRPILKKSGSALLDDGHGAPLTDDLLRST
jgi:hypothetical protein